MSEWSYEAGSLHEINHWSGTYIKPIKYTYILGVLCHETDSV